MVNLVRRQCNPQTILGNINAMKRSLYVLIGCSLRYSSLSPQTLSKLYWSVAIPRLVSGCEVRFFSPQELTEYEKCHRSVAKNIQCLPKNCPDAFCLATMGLSSVQSYIEKLKLLFVWRILSLPPTSIYRKVFILMFLLCYSFKYYDLY